MLDQCKQNPCQNGGTCDNKDGGYSCSCLPQWSGKNCDEGAMWILQSDSLREEASYKDSELMEQCNTDKTPNNPHAGTV